VKIVEKKAKSREQQVDSAHPIGEQREAHGSEKRLDKRRDSLANRLKAGNRAAAAELVDMYYEQIYLFMRRLGHSCQASEDLTQESFLQVWQHIGQLREGKALNSWLYRIASNVSKLYWRRHKGKEIAGIDGIDVADDAEAGSERSERREQLDRLNSAVGRLSIKLRQAVVLHYMQHLTIAEASEAVGVTQGTFKSRLHRALTALRKQVS
jgi:RNA polymerase sigma-70 factor (ECF subfamily)